MIARNKKNSVMITTIGMILIAAIAVCGCTGAVLPSETSAQDTPAASGSNIFTLKDGSVSVTIPEGWEVKDSSDHDIIISKGDGENSIDIQSDDILSYSTPDTIMKNTGFCIAYNETGKTEPQTEVIYPSIISGSALSVDGIDGKLFEITASVKYNNSELHGYVAVFVGSGKSYSMSYLSSPEDFETNKDIVKSVISSAKFNAAKETAFTLKDGSISVTVPEGWEAKDISAGATYALGRLISGDEKNEIKIECRRTLGENVTPDSAMGPFIMYAAADGSEITYTDALKTTWTYDAGDGSGMIYAEGGEGVVPESVRTRCTITYSGDGMRLVELDVSNGSGEALTVSGTGGKLYSLKGGDQQGYMAIFVANGKVYKISYFAGSEDFENNKDLVKSVILSAKFN